MSAPNATGDVRIDVAQWERSKNWVGVIIVTIIGVAAFGSAVSGHGVLGGTGVRIVVGLLGALFLIGGVAGIIAGFRGPHQEYVTVGPTGVAFHSAPIESWALAWNQIAGARLDRVGAHLSTRQSARGRRGTRTKVNVNVARNYLWIAPITPVPDKVASKMQTSTDNGVAGMVTDLGPDPRAKSDLMDALARYAPGLAVATDRGDEHPTDRP
jgi:hypothetical protein